MCNFDRGHDRTDRRWFGSTEEFGRSEVGSVDPIMRCQELIDTSVYMHVRMIRRVSSEDPIMRCQEPMDTWEFGRSELGSEDPNIAYK